jgi:hypothetical protein
MHSERCTFSPIEVDSKGKEIAQGLTNFFWMMSEYQDNLNVDVAANKRVPELLGRLFGFREMVNQKKSSLTQKILTDAIEVLTSVVFRFSNAPRFTDMIGRLNKVLDLCAVKSAQMEKGAENQAVRRKSLEPTR